MTTPDAGPVTDARHVSTLSARHPFSRRQRLGLVVLAIVTAAAFLLTWRVSLAVILSICALYFLVSSVDKFVLVTRGMSGRGVLRVSDDEARAIPDADLPVYTVLLPVYGEPEIVANLVAGVGKIDYPADKLDILLVLEADDHETRAAVEHADLDGITPVLVPPSEPRTKPKACNVAMSLPSERSDIVTIYDAEDIPDPLQLRRAAAVFAASPPEVGSVQARLGYYNERENLLTRWFAIEYDQWFSYMLPALSASKCVIPLGGTSNHIRTDVLREVGGWDAYNVTEDADLGIRLARYGYRTVVLDSLTGEEANADVVNWVRQRSRWYKGYLQTFLVHTRHPVEMVRELGLVPALRISNLTAGMPIANTLNLLFWTLLLIWFAGKPDFMHSLFPGPIYYLCVLMFTVGNLSTIMLGVVSTRTLGKPYLLGAALLVPGYWFLQSMAAIKSMAQLIYKPSYWEKTVHGLSAMPGVSRPPKGPENV
ncbi:MULTISPECIES: glycosyltransferase family 2 protein [unclassified Gordonia (in: high G+C Gram-positive bacteria)]|uniref:glycosyltransferase family 2 protein n=1 Tax=unclassified Gordonia (in: high G+C Gram-positive bacteria) TaxID=2657482 RepID=UPI001963D5FE|nr:MULTISPECIES: glycosyltransferase family 2 protein [unclassified Gordonia (in: high G+C Gram-positive bacteria)]MBN0974516.1 glycosyltransferase [Gordonia sp. BP-119]MBN0984464.1 glycosyltransferase [Gordonia sp. BP-94]WGJ86598.1 glycosyltransferase family 2 protein [Gordonia sp. SMJS1]